MLWLKNINKVYETAGTKVEALHHIDLGFRDNEFVAILGPSGCGKTTLLNIIGGLDRYTKGDLIINGISTKEYHDKDWDIYRNHSIGFVFQTYNLIPHQTVLANVELALTLSGVGRKERRKRAADALKAVGLGDQLHKKPNQMSGGQMQRVAIARALVNNPDILLADEPTGALDTETSIQVMDILQEVARDRLVIMVTHNPDLAEQYATRIVRLLDGNIVNDTMPLPEEELQKEREAATKKKKQKKTSMSFGTALSLSLNNLLTKKARTVLTSFAGSIGIIGIALILSMSSGFQNYINRVQEDTLSNYPITIQNQEIDMSGLLSSFAGDSEEQEEFENENVIHSVDMAGELLSSMQKQIKNNDLKSFYKYVNENKEKIDSLTSAVRYGYDLQMNLYNTRSEHGITRVNPSTVPEAMGAEFGGISMFTSSSQWDVFNEMIDNEELLREQYDLVDGHWPTNYDEVVLIVSRSNGINIMSLYTLGILDQSTLAEQFKNLGNGEAIESQEYTYTFDDVLCRDGDDESGWRFNLVVNSDFYKKVNGVYVDCSKDEDYVKTLAENGKEIKVVGIIRPSEKSVAGSLSGAIGYTSALTRHLIAEVEASEAVREQMNDPTVDIFSGLLFKGSNDKDTQGCASEFRAVAKDFDIAKKAEIMKAISAGQLTAEERREIIANRMLGMTEEESQALTQRLTAKIMGYMSSDMPKFQAIMKDYGALFSKLQPSGGGEQPELTPEETALFCQLVDETMGDELIAESGLTDEEYAEMFNAYIADVNTPDEALAKLYEENCLSQSDYEANMKKLSVIDESSPKAIYIYPKDFASKDEIEGLITEYNNSQTEDEKKISYTDYIGIFISSISTIIDTISYVLIGFVSISLVVSSIMIGVITYISVLERTKEIGILRSIGASKHDIRMVFNAETFIVGLISGLIGIGVTLLLIIPINIIIQSLSGIVGIASLPWLGGLILITISVVLTVISGLIPSGFAARRDPVVALRTE